MGVKYNPFAGNLDIVDSPSGDFSDIEISGDLTLGTGTPVTTVQAVTPTANRTISFPDQTGTVALVAGATGAIQYNESGAQTGTVDFAVDPDWNNASTTFTGLKLNVTDTASAAGSKLVDIQSNGTSKVVVDDSGNVGVDVTTPTYKLDLYKTSGTNRVRIRNTGTTATDQSSFQVTAGASDFIWYATGNENKLKLWDQNGSADRVVIDGSGNVGIGVTAPTRTLHVSSAGSSVVANLECSSQPFASVSISNTGGSAQVTSLNNDLLLSPASTERMRIGSTGETRLFGTNTVFNSRSAAAAGSGSDRLFQGWHSATNVTTGGTISFVVYTNGDVANTNNAYGAISDLKLKENIVDANSQWDDIKGLRLVNYNFKEETGHQTHTQLGLIAQEVEQVSPGLVGETADLDENGDPTGEVTKSVNYSVLYMKAVGALQEAIAKIEVLEAKVAALEAG